MWNEPKISNVIYYKQFSIRNTIILIGEGCVFIRKTVVQKYYIMYTWNIVTLRKTSVYLFVLKSGNRITIHVDYVSDKYQM